MKKILIFLCLAFFANFACNQSGQNTQNNDENEALLDLTKNPGLKLQIYYFHSTSRCGVCNSIETNVNEVLDSSYAELVKNGSIDFKLVNVDEEANKPLAKKFDASGMNLRFIKIENNKEKDNDLTEFAMLHSKAEADIFKKGITDTIAYFLK
jgi:hypothetical protein